MVMHSHRKNPVIAMPCTIIIIPIMKKMVDQLIPTDSFANPWGSYQNSAVKIPCRFKVCHMASVLCMQIPKTRINIRQPLTNATICRSICSQIIRANITIKIKAATICAAIVSISLPENDLLIVHEAKNDPYGVKK